MQRRRLVCANATFWCRRRGWPEGGGGGRRGYQHKGRRRTGGLYVNNRITITIQIFTYRPLFWIAVNSRDLNKGSNCKYLVTYLKKLDPGHGCRRCPAAEGGLRLPRRHRPVVVCDKFPRAAASSRSSPLPHGCCAAAKDPPWMLCRCEGSTARRGVRRRRWIAFGRR
jgi:hypothetical protein